MDEELPSAEELAGRFEPLFRQGRMPLGLTGLGPDTVRRLGFEVTDGKVYLPPTSARLDERSIRDALTARAREWVNELVIHQIVGSTNTLLGDLALEQSIQGVIRMAELQVQGRGRRGRSWISPYANNLAMSIGAELARPPEQLGGFSLCVGLAVADCLESLGLEGVELKWPNDVLLDGRKVAGILIELHKMDAGPRSGTHSGTHSGTRIVVGVGLNVRISPEARRAIDQPVADLGAASERIPRNRLAGSLISSLVDFIEGFAAAGFEPMRETYDRVHRFHHSNCLLLLGEEQIQGVVRGVTAGGELLLEVDGEVRSFGAGEVSLRPDEG
jgi:BirA family biotin operon repressor/biotin-[acetyl-CoA-carboxylase] ligase